MEGDQMKIKYNVIPKQQVVCCREDFTIKEAQETLEKSGYRCVPVLDKTGIYFRGNIYIQEVYRAIVKENVNWDDSVTRLIEDEDIYIAESASFFRIFTNIKKYPYLAVTDENKQFTGILTHANVMSILEDSWGIKTGSYTMTVSTHEYQGALSTIVDAVKKYTNLQSLMSIDNESTFFRRIILTLPSDTTEETMKKTVKELENQGFRVFDIEKI